jgi:putative transposase
LDAFGGSTVSRACRIVGQPRGTQRYTTIVRADEDALTQAIITLASQYGRYGYRRIKSLLDEAGWDVGCDRVQRIWRREGLKVPKKQRPRGRLWLNDGSCIRLRPERRNHVWSYDFVEAQTHDGLADDEVRLRSDLLKQRAHPNQANRYAVSSSAAIS